MSDDKNKKSPLRSYAEYSGLGLELVAIVLVCVFIGVKLDE
ncbi:MAG: AtpZ/AtpI family protein, partial [Bacteroidales bacterium]|nr:AtpZ/AtpI family protein [Bacteroidales bacterium]